MMNHVSSLLSLYEASDGVLYYLRSQHETGGLTDYAGRELEMCVQYLNILAALDYVGVLAK